jgi:hypothetical protein
MYFIVAWQGDYEKREGVSPVVIFDGEKKSRQVVQLFNTQQEGIEFARENLVPDYDYVVVPFFRVAQTAVYRYLQRERNAQLARMSEDEKKANCPECLGNYVEVGETRYEDMVSHVRVRCLACNEEYWRVYEPCQIVFKGDNCGLDLEGRG